MLPWPTPVTVTGVPVEAPDETDRMIDTLVERGLSALAAYDTFTQEHIDTIVAKASVAALSRHTELAQLAVEETGRGLFEDKAVKNIFACEHVPHHMAGLKTVGVISRDEINGIVEIAEPVGVVCAVTPVTNPTSTTVVQGAAGAQDAQPGGLRLPPGGPAVQRRGGAHRAGRGDRGRRPGALRPVDREPVRDGHRRPDAPPGRVGHPGHRRQRHGPGGVLGRQAGAGVGAGNVPAYLHRGAKLARAVHDVVLSKSFDNGMVCASEQAAIIDAGIYDAAMAGVRAAARLPGHRAGGKPSSRSSSSAPARAAPTAPRAGSTPRWWARAPSGSPSGPGSPCRPAPRSSWPRWPTSARPSR
ncbi:hypothetical protein GCM10020358_09360 [Amorphoplanes nipponensis]